MANKAILGAALLISLVSIATATTYTTTVVTTSVDENGNPQRRQCSQQVQGRQFETCQQYLRQGSPFNEEEEEMFSRGGRQQYLQQCCQELKEMDRQQCGCEAIKQAVRQAQQEGGGYQTGQSEQIYQKARSLPGLCRLREQQCSFTLVVV